MSTQMISILLNLILGGGFIAQLVTLRSMRKKAGSEAKGAEADAEKKELDNVEKAIKIWREMAENVIKQRDEALLNFTEMAKQVEALRRDVQKLNHTNQRILKLLDKISHENLESTVEEIKSEIQKSDA